MSMISKFFYFFVFFKKFDFDPRLPEKSDTGMDPEIIYWIRHTACSLKMAEDFLFLLTGENF